MSPGILVLLGSTEPSKVHLVPPAQKVYITVSFLSCSAVILYYQFLNNYVKLLKSKKDLKCFILRCDGCSILNLRHLRVRVEKKMQMYFALRFRLFIERSTSLVCTEVKGKAFINYFKIRNWSRKNGKK